MGCVAVLEGCNDGSVSLDSTGNAGPLRQCQLRNSDELLSLSSELLPLGAAVATATMRAKKTTNVVFILKV